MTTEREHLSGGARPTRLSSQLNAGSTSLSVTTGGLATWPDGTVGRIPVVINRGLADEEHLRATAVAGDTLTGLIRGQDDTVDQTHPSGATVEHGLFADHIDAANEFLSAPTGAGQVAISTGAGEWDAGTLPTGFALDAPTIANLTNAQHDHSDADDGGSLAFGSPVGSSPGQAPFAGVVGAPARADHVHGRESYGTPGSSSPGDAAAQGSDPGVARPDHRHGREPWASTHTLLPGLGQLGGAGTTTAGVARGDHTHTLPDPDPATALQVGAGNVNQEGVSTAPSRADHRHQLPLQVGVKNITLSTANAATGSVVFDAPFAATPVVTLGIVVGSNNDIIPNITSVSTTGFNLRVFTNTGNPALITVSVHWAAHGAIA